LAALVLGGARAVADTTAQPTTPPTAPSGVASKGAMRPGPAYVIQRYKRAVGQLDLGADDKAKVDGVFGQVNRQGLDLSQTLTDSALQERFQKLAAFSKQIRQEFAAVLSDDQMKALDKAMGSQFGGSQSGGSQAAGSQAGGSPQADQQAAGKGNGGGKLLDNMQQALDKLDLTSAQRDQIKDLMASTREKLAEIRKNAAAGGDVKENLQQARQDLRNKLKLILKPEQMEAFAQAMQQMYPDRGGGANRSRLAGSDGNGSGKQNIVDNKPADLQTSGPDVGSPAPDSKIIQLNGRAFSLSQYKGHVLVLEFGSMSCPVFRTHVQEMEKLKAAEGSRAFFMIVYTREAFPAGDKNVERNRDEGISVPQAKTIDERKTEAMEAGRELRITIPMATDTMDDAISTAYGSFPNGTVVIGKDGNIAARQQWTNPDSLRTMIDDACQATVAPTATAAAPVNH